MKANSALVPFVRSSLVIVVYGVLSLTSVLSTAAQTMSTIAGNGTAGYSGDGGPATAAELNYPNDVWVDGNGNVYIVDWYNDVIRELNGTTGTITTVAGGGGYGFSGDGGPATSAELQSPGGVTLDSAGNMYFADSGNERVRKVTAATGIISTVAGDGKAGYAGDGGPATGASLFAPTGVAFDPAGNMYISDTYNNVVRKVDATTGIITTFAGNGYGAGAGFGGYSGDGGPATGAEMHQPTGVASDSSGNVYIADSYNSAVREVTAMTGVITTVAGDGAAGYGGDGGPASSAELDLPCRVALDSAGNLYIGDCSNQRIRKVTAGIITTVAGDGVKGFSGDGGPAISAELSDPTGVSVDLAGNLFIADTDNQRIRKVAAATPTTTGLAAAPNPSTYGQSVTFTATVMPAGPPVPTGTISFTSNGATITGCSAIALASTGTAPCVASNLPAGSDAIVAAYSGDSNYAGSSGTLTQVVNLAVTTTSVASSLNPSTFGKEVTFTATVSGGVSPTGTVGFTSNAAAISGCGLVSLVASQAQCSTSALPVGTDSIAASYSGDGNNIGSIGTVAQLVNPVPVGVEFVPVTPCRVVDTRNPDGPFGGPEIAIGTSRSFAIPAGPCAGIPGTATAYSLNVTVVPPGPLGFVTIWPTGEGQPLVSTLNSLDGRIKANAAIVPAGTAASGGAVSVYANNTTHVVLDINGYFESSSSPTLQFFPLTPCRVADTRKAAGPLGGPALVAATERDFPILSSICSIPTTALAYSLNFTAVPPSGGTLAYLTVWPEGAAQPLVSTLNDPTGTIVANAALVPAGTNGGVAVYATDATNLVIDVNGYFAPPATGGLSLYTLTPCRILDTRKTTGLFNGELTVNVVGSTCAPPSTAQAFVFNATVVPSGDLGYLTVWPDGEAQPVVSTLNAEGGYDTSNMAIVPNKDGKTDAFASGTTQLVMDISAYFAP